MRVKGTFVTFYRQFIGCM